MIVDSKYKPIDSYCRVSQKILRELQKKGRVIDRLGSRNTCPPYHRPGVCNWRGGGIVIFIDAIDCSLTTPSLSLRVRNCIAASQTLLAWMIAYSIKSQ